MKKFITLALASAAVLSATPAFADVQSGFRAEGLVGYDEITADLTDFGLGEPSEGGFAYGVGLGYDFAVSEKAALGVDLEFADSSTNIEYDDGIEAAGVSTGRDLYVGARATFAVSDSINLYAKAGYTNARVNAFYDDGVTVISDSANGDGIRGGIGAQLNLDKLYVFTEYRYSNYEAGISRNQGMAGLGFRF